MNNFGINLILIFFLTGCSTVERKYNEVLGSAQYLVNISKNLELKFNEQGDFLELLATAKSPISMDLPSAKENAISVATIRAKAEVAEFLNTGITSDAFTDQLVRVLDDSNDFKTSVNKKTATIVQENIIEKSQSIFKNIYVLDIKTRKGVVSVSIVTNNRFKKTLKKIEDVIIN